MMVRILGINRRFWKLLSGIGCDGGQIGLNLRGLREVMVDSKALSIKLILHAKEITSIVHIVTWSGEVWPSLDRTLGNI